MGLEGFQSKKRESAVEAKVETLMRDLADAEYFYCSGLFEGELPLLTEDGIPGSVNNNKNEEAFRNIFLKYSEIEIDIYGAYCQARLLLPTASSVESLEEFKRKNGSFTNFRDLILSDAFVAYKRISHKDYDQFSWWLKEVEKCICRRMDGISQNYSARELQKYEQEKSDLLRTKSETSVGLIEYKLENLSDFLRPEYISQNYSHNPSVARIHMQPFFLQRKGIFSTDSVTEAVYTSFKKLVKKLSKDHPEVKFSVADSWVLDLPIAKQFGFTLIPPKQSVLSQNFFNTPGFWGQFISKQGELHKDRLEKLVFEGIPPRQVKSGYVDVESLKRALESMR